MHTQIKCRLPNHHPSHPYDASCDEPAPDTLRSVTPEDTARATLHDVAHDLERDEVRVLTRIAEHLLLAKRIYVPLLVDGDARWLCTKEVRDRVEDALVCLACVWATSEVSR
jgi:hypothetical protein